MSQLAEISRFCAVEGIFCERLVPYQGTNSFFFAYPSGEHWQDFSQHLVADLKYQEIHGTRWQDVVSNDVLFAKVCDSIHGHDYLVAEVTEPNANVLLEVGYALAVGRPTILLQDQRRPPWARTLLTAFDNCFYETRENVVPYIVETQANRGELSESPDRRLLFLERMGIFDPAEEAATIHHLKPKVARDWISSVEKTLKASDFDVSGTDPSDSSYDEFYSQARAIQRASRIVGSLLGTDIPNYQEHNANVATLIGFAIGLGKEVLVLQAEPRASILDLGTMSQLFTTETQAVGKVRRWLTEQTRAALRQRTEARVRARETEHIAQIRQVYLGHPDALQDASLLEYFVPTPDYEDAIQGRRTLYVGRRGTGKSANFKAICDELRDRFNTVPVEIAPSDYELQRITGYLETHDEDTTPTHLYQPTWNYVLITEMVKSLTERTDILLSSGDDADSYTLRQYYDANRAALELDFGSRVTQALTAGLEATTGNVERTTQEATQSAINGLLDYRISRRLQAFANKEDITFFLVADDLDKHWNPSNEQSIDLLIGLINEAARLQIFFVGRLKVVMFLRQDIFDAMAKRDDDLPKRSFLRMEWTHANLKHLVAERLAKGADIQVGSDQDIWAAIFPEQVNDTEASDYILSRALPRPRDVLSLCQAAIDQAQKNGHSRVTARDIIDGESANATNFVRSLEAEFAASYPHLGVVLNVFSRIGRTMKWDEFDTLAGMAIQEHEDLLNGWSSDGPRTTRWLGGALYEIGLIGLSPPDGSTGSFRNGQSFDETWTACAPQPLVHIHPAFFAYLRT